MSASRPSPPNLAQLGSGTVTLRSIASFCTKTVRSVTESEEEALDLVTSIWNAIAAHAAYCLKVGKSLSLYPLGVLYMSEVGGGEQVPRLFVSELFTMQYGILADAGPGPGPNLKPSIAEVAAAVRVSDKAIIPNVLAALLNQIGEVCSQQYRLEVEFGSLGTLVGENKHLEFVPAKQSKPGAPHARATGGPGEVATGGTTVQAMLRRRTGAPPGGARSSRGLPGLPGAPGAPGAGAAGMGKSMDPFEVPMHSARFLGPEASSVFASMIGRRTELDGGHSILTPRHPNLPKVPLAPLPAAGASPRPPPRLSRLAETRAAEGLAASPRPIEVQVTMTQPTGSLQYPPLLEEFSRTLAAPYEESGLSENSSSRIASRLSALAAFLYWNDEGKCLKWRALPRKKNGESSRSGPPLDFAPDDVIEKTFKDQQIPRDSPLDLEMREANMTRRTFYGGLLRYRYYVNEGIKDEAVSPINRTWVDNIGYLVDVERFFRDMTAKQVDKILTDVHNEMMEGYLGASKKAIVDYVLRDERCKLRVLVPLVPAPVADWGTVPFVGIEGTVGGPPDEWRAGIEQSRDAIVRALTVCNQSALCLLKLWHGSTLGFGETLLADIPDVTSLSDIDAFSERQRACCLEVVQKFKTQWFEEVCGILRQENLYLGGASEARFFAGIARVLSTQLRATASQSMDALVDFFGRFSGPDPLPAEEVTELKDTEERQAAFLTIKLVAKGDEVRLKDPTDKIADKISRIFRDVVSALDDIPLPESRISNRAIQPNQLLDRCILGTSHDEQHVQIAESFIDGVVSMNMQNIEKCVHLYDPFTFLLTEEDRVSKFLKEGARAIDEYRSRYEMLKATDAAITERLPSSIRMQMACVECSELNELLHTKVADCIKILLESVTAFSLERNEKLCEGFASIMKRLQYKPTGAQELVDVERDLEKFRAVTQKDLLEDFADIRAWQNFLFDSEHLLAPKDFKAITDSAHWVYKIDDELIARENALRTERDDVENKFKKERSQFDENLEGYSNLVNKFKDAGNPKQMEEYLERILALKEHFDRAKVDAERFREKEILLGWDPSEFEKLTEGIEKLHPYDDLWELVYKFSNEEKKWMRGPLFSIEPELVNNAAIGMGKRCVKLQALFESLNLPTPASVAKKMKKELDAFKQHLPLIHALCNPGLRQRHWDEISEVVGFALERDQAFTLIRVIDMEVGRHMLALQEISDAAAREHGLETTMDAMHAAWNSVHFELKAWKDTETYIVTATTVDEMQSLMDDHIIKVQTMKGSPFAKPFMESIVEMENWLLSTQEIMEIWMKVQSVWLYLEPIFGSEDIVKQMPTEAGLFKKVDGTWRSIMAVALESGEAKVVTKADGLLQQLQECHVTLDTVQKGLNDYLETKRLAFPRFFFLSNDNLLEILSETKEPSRVNPHMKKAFEGIQSLEFGLDGKISAMVSPEKEKVQLLTAVDPAKARGNVEQWLVEVEAAMIETVRHVVMASSEDYTARRFTEWLGVWPGQVVIAVFGLFWSQDVEAALRGEGSAGVRKYSKQMKTRLAEIIELVRSEIAPLVRCTLEALIVLFVHNKDTVADLTKAGVEKENDFEWLVQMRYYIEENPDKPGQQDMFVRITNSFLGYAYEYIGNSSRLIVTPLTDRCYRTCCGALHLLYGAAPEGPAGTGKTETVKDLAKGLARFCVVFNCSDELDTLAMAKFFKGLAASGGWLCFDEFNRIDPEVLSVVAQQILSIQLAVKERKTSFEFEGTTLPIIWTCNCFITMNPGYAGRAELPDNLKALFRTVAMMVPDYAMIAEIKLYAFGYEDSRSLAQKIVTTYTLCSEQLSSQKHYDYGMRAVFAVLVRAGSLKRQFPQQNESILMLQSVNDVNLAKFLDFDVPLYTGITQDLFPGVVLPKPDYSVMIDKLTEHLDKSYCQAHPYFVDKIIQFYECHLVRHSVMLVGLPFSGKTTALGTLQKALTDLAASGAMHAGCAVHQARLNPKSVPAKDLYGCFDEISHEWTDGIVAVLFREFARNQSDERKWLVFDGPVDAVWIENMNTVMDENKKLCLNSGEIIAMSPNMRTIIEPMDVEVASPATISRNGMVFFEPHLMGYQHLIDKTFRGSLPAQLDTAGVTNLQRMVDIVAKPIFKYVHEQSAKVSPTQEQSLVQSFLAMLTTHLGLAFKEESIKSESADPKTVTAAVDGYVLFSLIWGVGVACETTSRVNFGQYFRKLLSGQVEKRIHPPFPDRGSVFDYTFDIKSLAWMSWMETVPQQVIPNNAPVESIIVQTPDNVRYRYILNHCITNRIKLLFCGPTGTGKTVYMQQALMELDKDAYMQLFIGFSAKTNCAQTQSLIDAKIERRRKGVYGPPMGKYCVVMVDDLNMPVKEQFGAQPPIEILRQGCDTVAYPSTGGWYDCKDNTHPFRSIVDVLYFAAMGLPGGGRSFITPRILGLFYLVGFTLLEEDNMVTIFNTVLDHKFRADNYPGDVAQMSKKLVQATLDVYKGAAKELLPTPLKVHYTFNLRDFAKVVSGILLLKKEEAAGPEGHVRLWVHEVMRVFGDRLIDDTDRLWVLMQLRDQAKKTFQMSFDDILGRLDNNNDGKVDTLDEIRGLFFGDMMSPAMTTKRPYAEVPDPQALQQQVEAHLIQHNEQSSKPMDLVCFLYMLEHLSRVARIIKSPGGNALLVGVGGAGRQSATRLACFVADCGVFQIEIAKGYNLAAFREDMKKMLTKAGGEGERTIFLFSDTQIKDEGFVEDTNNLLNSGEIPNLFPADEKVAVCELVRNPARDEGKAPDGTPTQLFGYFVERCRALLSCVVCFSPIGDAWRSRLRQFPSLVNCCTIDWFTVWPNDALVAVARRFLGQIPNLDDKVRRSCVEMCNNFHTESRHLAVRFQTELKRVYYSTPTSFLELIQTFKQLLAEKRGAVGGLKTKYDVGLDKLTTTEQSVEGMKQDLIELQPQLVEKNKEVGEMMIVVNAESAKTEEVKIVVAADEAVASDAAARSNAIKEDCEKELGEAMPALNEALKALDTLSSKEISEIKAMKNPPAPVRIVLTAVCVLRGYKPVRVKDESGKMVDDYWPSANKMISEMGFLQALQSFDKDNIPPALVKKIGTYTVQEDFQPDRVERVSRAAWGLCMWVRAMETYDRVAKVVAPKTAALAEAEQEYNGVMKKLNGKRAELQSVVDKLLGLNSKLASLRKEQDDLTAEVDMCSKKLDRAETLITSLGGEKTRWTQNSADLAHDYTNLTGDVIVASGVIAYLGAFTPEFREGTVQSWAEQAKSKEIPGSAIFSLERCLGEPVKVRAWTIAGLPNDAFSIENGIIVDKARRWPLCIDPQGQANRWIKRMGQPQHIVISKFSDGDYLKRLEGCIQFGNPMLIENIAEETDPAVEPVLLRQTFKKGNQVMLKLGEAIVEYSKDFRLYLTTKLRNPHYLPEVAVKVTLLNFMITQVGLQDQLLNIVVVEERPDLAEDKARLVLEGAENKEQLEVTENRILDVLSSSQGNILEDEAAVQVLSASKQLSNEIAQKQKVAEETERKIDEARLGYEPVAFKTAILFFSVADLANIDPMYQYSLPFFVNLFKSAIAKSEPDEHLPRRIAKLNEFFMDMLYKNICRSLFERHKLLFSFLLTMQIQITTNVVSMADYRFLLTGGTSLDEPPMKPAVWIPDRLWSELFKLGRVNDAYAKLAETFGSEIPRWRSIYDSAEPLANMQSDETRPSSMAGLGFFQQLMVLRCVRPDRVLPAVMDYVSAALGEKYVTPPPFDLVGSYTDSSNTSPLIFVLSPGADPFSALTMFAAEKGKEINSLSLGQGQGPKAEKMMEDGFQAGGWVLLQNCHVFASWMPRLEKILEQLDPKQIQSDFRLWLTSYPSDKFPVAVLQNSVKITNEAPKGIRANLIGSYLMDPINSEEFFDGCQAPGPFKRLLYALCFFHAVIQERRLFGPLGWNIPYEFTQNDLRISARQLRMFIDESPDQIPFKAINYLTGECNYGGRVTEGQDRRLLMTLLTDYYCEGALKDDFALCAAHPEFKIPPAGTQEEMMEALRSLPLVMPPGLYGFHENANLTREQNETYDMMEKLLLTVGQSGGGGGGSSEDAIALAADDILHRLPAGWDVAKVQESYPTLYEESMNTVLVQELNRFNNLTGVIKSSLKDIQKAVKGLMVMSEELEKVFGALFNGKTPEVWLKSSYPSLKPLGGYTNDLIERLKFFQTWVSKGMPVIFWISGIYFTQAFTTGASQNFARKYTIPIDTLCFDFEMPKDQDPKARPANGVYSNGLFLEGCKWDLDTWQLVESDPKVLFVPVPLIWIVPCKKVELRTFPSYECPVYKVSTRKGVLSTTGHSTNYVMPVRVNSSKPESLWVKRGVAMLTSLDT